MRHLAVLALVTACVGQMPPPPELNVTSPDRGHTQGGANAVLVKGTTGPNADGDPVSRVMINGTQAQLAADGSFTATVDLSAGATLLQTTAYTSNGGETTDSRAVQVGELRPFGSVIDRAVTASISKEAFAKLAATAGPAITALDLPSMLKPQNPMAKYGDSLAFVDLSINSIAMGNMRLTLVPTNAGLAFTAEVDSIAVGAKAHYDGTFVPEGSTNIMMRTDKITLSGTFNVAPAGNTGFTATIMSPSFHATNMKLDASGLVGSIAELVYDNMSGTINKVMNKSVEGAMAPMLNKAFGALAGPQHVDVLDRGLDLVATPSAVQFSDEGALVTLNLGAQITGSQSERGFVFTPNGTPDLDLGSGIALGLSDDLVNEMLAQVHALHMLDVKLDEDLGLVDHLELAPKIPPMVSANNADGSMRLVLGDVIANFTKNGNTVIKAAVNAQVDVQVLRGRTPDELSVKFGDIRVWVDIMEGTAAGYDIKDFASNGIGLQVNSLAPFLVKVPLPSVQGVSFDNLEMHADAGYLVMSGDVH